MSEERCPWPEGKWDAIARSARLDGPYAVIVDPATGQLVGAGPDIWSARLEDESRVVFWSELEGKERRPGP